MRQILAHIYRHFKKMLRIGKWIGAVPTERKKIQKKLSLEQKFDGRVMILIPHSDDEWIGCSRLVCSAQDTLLCNMNMNGDDSPELHQQRDVEMKCNADRFAKEIVLIDSFLQLKEEIEKYRPTCIFVPFIIDWHEEHYGVLNILHRALNLLDLEKDRLQIGMYQVSVPLPPSAVTHCLKLPFLKWLGKWRRFLLAYPSQKGISYQRFALQEVINGKHLGVWAGEVYSVCDAQLWSRVYSGFSLNEEAKKTLRTELNNMTRIREIAISLWNARRL